ncbi:MAG: HAD-IA family hydrolase [Vicingaceae bacterium]
MELKGIKNIIFDLGGVLLNLNYNLTKQAFVKLGVQDYDSHFTQSNQILLFDAFETGKISENDFFEQLRILTGINFSEEELLTAWNAMLLDFPIQRKDILLNLKKEFNISLLSNTNESHIRAFTKIIQKEIGLDSLEPLFDSVHYSNEIGFRKPTEEAFKHVLEHNSYVAEQTLFLDDSAQHLEGAKRCGIQTVFINNVTVEVLFADFLA